MTTKQSLTSIGQLVPELPVTSVERAQQHYRDALGFEIGWLHPDGIGAVSRGNVAIFFRKTTPPFAAAVHWVFARKFLNETEIVKCGRDVEKFRIEAKLSLTALLSRE